MKKITLIVIIIAAAILIGFGFWAITPYFTNTTINEPLPTGLIFPTLEETKIVTHSDSSIFMPKRN